MPTQISDNLNTAMMTSESIKKIVLNTTWYENVWPRNNLGHAQEHNILDSSTQSRMTPYSAWYSNEWHYRSGSSTWCVPDRLSTEVWTPRRCARSRSNNLIRFSSNTWTHACNCQYVKKTVRPSSTLTALAENPYRYTAHSRERCHASLNTLHERSKAFPKQTYT